MDADPRAELQRLIARLPEAVVPAALRVVAELAAQRDPVLTDVLAAEEDDEELNEVGPRMLKEARADSGAGRTHTLEDVVYSRGMTTREIRAYVEELYGVTVSRELISKVTDEVHEELREWRLRPLEAVYSIVYFDALRVKIREEGVVQNKAVHLAIGVTVRGVKEILGMWTSKSEGAKFWLGVMNELKSRGVRDVLIVVVDGLKGLPEAIETAFPEAMVDLPGASDPVFADGRLLEAAQGSGGGAASDLPGEHGGGGEGSAGRVRGRPLGSEVSGDRAELAAELVAGDPVLRVFGADPAGDLHDERHREPERYGAAGGPDARTFPERPRGGEADLPGAEEHHQEVEKATPGMACCQASVRHPVWRPICSHGLNHEKRLSTQNSAQAPYEPTPHRLSESGNRSAFRPPTGWRRRRREPVESAVPGKSRPPPWPDQEDPPRPERFPQDLENARAFPTLPTGSPRSRSCNDGKPIPTQFPRPPSYTRNS